MAATVELWLRIDDIDKHALSIPIEECTAKAIHPLKWLRFLGYTIYGSTGLISLSPDGAELGDYSGNIEPRRYYFRSEDEAFLLDPYGMDDRTSVSTLSTRRADFREGLLQRDGSCVLTGAPAQYCDGCHLIPHAKGDQYMAAFLKYRGGEGDLNDINDLQNGLLLQTSLHRVVGISQLAFLQTPNFALTVDDIPFHAQPQHLPTSRLTVHYFQCLDPMVLGFVPQNSDMRQMANTNEWPPSVIFDFMYGCAVLKTWAIPAFATFLAGEIRDVYYDHAGYVDENDNQQNETQPLRKIDEQAKARGEWAARRQKRSTEGKDQSQADIVDLVMALWMRNSKKKRYHKQASEMEKCRGKVDAWLKAVE